MKAISFTLADYLIIGVLILSVIISTVRGFTREAISLVTWVLGLALALHFGEEVGQLLATFIHSSSLRLLLGSLSIFISVMILGAWLNRTIGNFVHKSILSSTDRILGVAFGLGRGALVISLLLLLAGLTSLPDETWWQSSKMIAEFKPMALWLKTFVPDNLKFHL